MTVPAPFKGRSLDQVSDFVTSRIDEYDMTVLYADMALLYSLHELGDKGMLEHPRLRLGGGERGLYGVIIHFGSLFRLRWLLRFRPLE